MSKPIEVPRMVAGHELFTTPPEVTSIKRRTKKSQSPGTVQNGGMLAASRHEAVDESLDTITDVGMDVAVSSAGVLVAEPVLEGAVIFGLGTFAAQPLPNIGELKELRQMVRELQGHQHVKLHTFTHFDMQDVLAANLLTYLYTKDMQDGGTGRVDGLLADMPQEEKQHVHNALSKLEGHITRRQKRHADDPNPEIPRTYLEKLLYPEKKKGEKIENAPSPLARHIFDVVASRPDIFREESQFLQEATGPMSDLFLQRAKEAVDDKIDRVVLARRIDIPEAVFKLGTRVAFPVLTDFDHVRFVRELFIDAIGNLLHHPEWQQYASVHYSGIAIAIIAVIGVLEGHKAIREVGEHTRELGELKMQRQQLEDSQG